VKAEKSNKTHARKWKGKTEGQRRGDRNETGEEITDTKKTYLFSGKKVNTLSKRDENEQKNTRVKRKLLNRKGVSVRGPVEEEVFLKGEKKSLNSRKRVLKN